MKYIKYSNELLYVFLEKKTIMCQVLPLRFIKELCYSRLVSYEGMVFATKKKLNIKTNVPIYLSSDLVLFPTKSPRLKETIWVNYRKILKFKKLAHLTIITFNTGDEITLDCSFEFVKKKIFECDKIIKHLSSEKMSVYNMWLVTFSSIKI